MIKSYMNNGGGSGAGAAILPPLDFTHLRTLTDDTGILQHATYSVPNREHGYCVDDNARALIVACDGWKGGECEELRDLVAIYLSFVIHAFNQEKGRFRNFMSYHREWLEDVGSEDSHGRTLWGLGVAAGAAPIEPQRQLAALLMERALPAVEGFASPRSLAFAILGLDRFLDHDRSNAMALEWMKRFADRIHRAFLDNRSGEWPWLEDVVTYANGLLPHALLAAGERLEDEGMIGVAADALEWLIDLQTAPQGHLRLIGNDGWMVRGGEPAQFDQQPLDAAALVLASMRASSLRKEEGWEDRANLAIAWFLGGNDLGVPLYDAATGGCCDGLGREGANANQGAESTVEWLLARLAVPASRAGRAGARAERSSAVRSNGWNAGA